MDEHEAVKAWSRIVGAARLEPMATVSNQLWRVIGEDAREWVIKKLPEWAPGAGPVDEYRVLLHLQRSGVPVAVPMITDDGLIAHNADRLGTGPADKQPTGTHSYVLIPALPSDPRLTESPELARTIGAAIGRLERALADCPWPVTSFTDDPAREILRERFADMPEALRELALPHRERAHEAIVGLPTQRITHGDCNVGNLLVHDGAVTGFIDLDHLPSGPRIRDLSYYLTSRLSAHLDHGDPAALAAVLPHYLEGFRSECPITEREFAAVEPMMLTVAIGMADWRSRVREADSAAYHLSLRTVGWLAAGPEESN